MALSRKDGDLTKVRMCRTSWESPTVQEQVIAQEIPQVQVVQQGCRLASGSAASGDDDEKQQKPWERP